MKRERDNLVDRKNTVRFNEAQGVTVRVEPTFSKSAHNFSLLLVLLLVRLTRSSIIFSFLGVNTCSADIGMWDHDLSTISPEKQNLILLYLQPNASWRVFKATKT